MQISFSFKTAKRIIDDSTKLSSFITDRGDYHFRTYLKNSDDKSDDDQIRISLPDINNTNLALLHNELSKLDYVSKKTISTIALWIDAIKNPANVPVTTLKNLETILIQAIKKNKKRWIAKQNPDGNVVLYAVTKVKHHHGRRDESASVIVSMECSRYQDKSSSWSDDDGDIKKGKYKTSVSFYLEDIGEVNDNIEDDEDEDEDEDKPKKKKKIVAKKLMDILKESNLFLVNDIDIVKYEDTHNALAYKISKKIGHQYISTSKGYVVPDNRKKGTYNISGWKNINTDDIMSKLVVDNAKDDSDISYAESDMFGELELPFHPYVLTYNITHHNYAIVFAESLVEYTYDKKVIDKLILANKKKKILQSLISNENNFQDIISGKSGGIIVLSTGIAGVGKTLTAEVYSELIGKPLYSIQSSQLGINVDDIEKNLSKILYRANKWSAILLIDEADSYVYKRGGNIIQNCIVGTFLRLLEYYNGILFMTSNRPEDIDDAVMSRVTIHMRYERPTTEEFVQLLDVLSKNMGMSFEKNFDKWYIDKYKTTMTGRDIRNFIKDVKKCFPSETIITKEIFTELSEFLPFVNVS